ncbi:major facilitator superfamily transporter [Colletotrichum graminicola]|nr:major facilitator superfamily transporter [Colletotrichum graminicola]
MVRNEKHDQEVNESLADEKPIDSQLEQAQALADLPDPDAGKTLEERAAIDKKLMWKVDLWLVPWLSLLREAPRYFTGHGVVLGYQILFLLGGSIFMHVALRIANRNRRAGKMDAKWAAMTDEQRWVAGDERPDFMYTL